MDNGEGLDVALNAHARAPRTICPRMAMSVQGLFDGTLECDEVRGLRPARCDVAKSSQGAGVREPRTARLDGSTSVDFFLQQDGAVRLGQRTSSRNMRRCGDVRGSLALAAR